MPLPFSWPIRNPTPPPGSPKSRAAATAANPFYQIHAGVSSFLSSLRRHLLQQPQLLPFPPVSPAFALIAHPPTVEERLAGVPVYALGNADGEFVLVSDARSARNLGLLCFRREDADALLEHVEAASLVETGTSSGSKVVALALNKVLQLKAEGVAFRFIPEFSQVAHAISVKETLGFASNDGFQGVPVFQSRSLVLTSGNRTFRPVFFRKEDLDGSLLRASDEQGSMNPAALRKGDIEVGTLEDIINDMKDGSLSKWGDLVFIPPGFDITNTRGTTSA